MLGSSVAPILYHCGGLEFPFGTTVGVKREGIPQWVAGGQAKLDSLLVIRTRD